MRRAAKRRAKYGPCDVFWGGHGCSKTKRHIGDHICSTGCARPTYEIVGRDVLHSDPRIDKILREHMFGAMPRASR